jgi:hypothetical protein
MRTSRAEPVCSAERLEHRDHCSCFTTQGPTVSPEQAAAAVAAAALIARQYSEGEEPDCEEQQPEWLLGTQRMRFRGVADVAQLMAVVDAAHRDASTCPGRKLTDALVSRHCN